MLNNFFNWAQRPDSSYDSDLDSSDFDCHLPPPKPTTTPKVSGAQVILSPVFNPWLVASPDIKNDPPSKHATVSTKYFTTKSQLQLPIATASTHPAQFQYSALDEPTASEVDTPLTYRVPSNFLEKVAPKEKVPAPKPIPQVKRVPLQPYKEISGKVSHVWNDHRSTHDRNDHRSGRSFLQPILQLQLEKYQRYAQYQPYLTKDITLITLESRHSSCVSGPNTIHLNLFHNGSKPDGNQYTNTNYPNYTNYNNHHLNQYSNYSNQYNNHYPNEYNNHYIPNYSYHSFPKQNDVLKFGFQVEFDINYAGLRRKLSRSKQALRTMLSNAKYGAKHRCHRIHRCMYRSGLTFIPVPPRY